MALMRFGRRFLSLPGRKDLLIIFAVYIVDVVVVNYDGDREMTKISISCLIITISLRSLYCSCCYCCCY